MHWRGNGSLVRMLLPGTPQTKIQQLVQNLMQLHQMRQMKLKQMPQPLPEFVQL